RSVLIMKLARENCGLMLKISSQKKVYNHNSTDNLFIS
uniref:Uncharacterized protein n=1 Tax=Caenorhabditis japonica TaxID=281687 RepID=A0A8R1ES35_CAEJA